ncbi:hypothetical protein FSARC_6432 [Fusarium sarcochroum]|uniref:Uncharacterized protein n=1 Tax=Fusarium sarcochroum TaxID=1208366 RepID=A0A8H4TXQ3_9HYPO|nr:hypothetical protein FSARC_6432 [Fusarium sarcochroum]
MPLLRPRHNDCSGWNCLTAAEQAGIIISIIVTSIVLLFAYMYYLGRITTAHQEIVLRRQRRRRRRRSNLAPVPTISLVNLPIVPQFPSQRVAYQPFLYSPNGAPVILPQFQGPPVPLSQQPVPVIYPVHPTGYVYPQPPFQPNFQQSRPNTPAQHLSPAPASISSRGLPPRQPSWRQHLRRVFGLTTGRASTVASNSAPGTPVLSQAQPETAHGETRRSLSRPGYVETDHAPRNNHEHQRSSGHSNALHRSAEDHQDGTIRLQSPVSVAATVHSDDYDLIPNPNPTPTLQNAAAQGYRPPDMASYGGAVEELSSNSSDIYSDDRQTVPVPAISPIPPIFDPRSRPPTPIPDAQGARRESIEQARLFRTMSLPNSGHGILHMPSPRRGASSTTTQDQVWNPYHRGREIRRVNWDRRHTSPSQMTEDGIGPIPPQSIHQGGGSYQSHLWRGGTMEPSVDVNPSRYINA